MCYNEEIMSAVNERKTLFWRLAFLVYLRLASPVSGSGVLGYRHRSVSHSDSYLFFLRFSTCMF